MRNTLVLGSLLLLVATGAPATATTAIGTPLTPLTQQLGLATPESQVGTPQPIFLAGCEVSIDCICSSGGFFTIYCGGSTCSHTLRSVTCDGNTTYCPPKLSC